MRAALVATIEFDRLAESAPSDAAAGDSEKGRYSVPGIQVTWRSPAAAFSAADGVVCLAVGAARFVDAEANAIAAMRPAEAWRVAYARHGIAAPSTARGAYGVVIVDVRGRTALLAADRFSRETLCFRLDGKRLHVSDRADEIAGSGDLDPQAIFDYLYFHMIPAPRTVFPDVSRLPPAHAAYIKDGRVQVAPFWQPVFDENGPADFAKRRETFLTLVESAVAHEIEQGINGAFLSGGTDSSTVAGMLGKVTGERPRTYSIGFDAGGYDEMEYARIAARHFNADHHEYYVTADDVVAAMPAVAAHHDQPFGNSSALPAYYCARLARDDGVTKLLAGDGGDELFGGNERYATQRIFDMYWRLPDGIRRDLIGPLFAPSKTFMRLPGLRQMSGYVRHSSVPMPDRIQAFNLLMRLGPAKVLEDALLARVDPARPAADQRQTYTTCTARSLINRMLAFDWKYTLADSDLPKVRGAVQMAGIGVGYPLLDDDLVDFSLALRPKDKLRRLKLRWFFKEALRGFLPNAIIAKRKHGFGLPFGVWLTSHSPLNTLARDALHGIVDRGIARRDFVADLLDRRLLEHPGYYGEMVWILAMLELWLQAHAPMCRLG